MITSRRNQIWGRMYDIGKTPSGAWQIVCTCGGKYSKKASLHLAEFERNTIEIDRNQFAQLLRQHRKNERNKHAEEK